MLELTLPYQRLLSEWFSIPISELNRLILWFVFVWHWVIGNPHVANLPVNASNTNDGSSID